MTDGERPPPPSSDRRIAFRADGRDVEVDDNGDMLLGALRDQLAITGPKDGCSPQGQCGCCTVLVDGQPRVACVTPTRRVRGRSVTTIDGLDPGRAERWADAFCSTGGSQCGFCTPGIVVRLDGLESKLAETGADRSEHGPVEQALLAHLCRCTGWQTIVEAWDGFVGGVVPHDRELGDAGRRAEIEGGAAQSVGPEIALGQGGFAADTVPEGSLIAVTDGAGGWALGETLAEARGRAGKVQGRRTTADHSWPLELPEGDWDATLRTTWVEPGFLETDASWCEPGGQPATPLANGGAFGAKLESKIPEVARELADDAGRPVLVLASREDTVRWGPKRPPVAGGARVDGSGLLRVVDTPGIVEAVAAVAPGLEVELVSVAGPPTSAAIRGAGWVEAITLLAGAGAITGPIASPAGALADARIDDGGIHVAVSCGAPLDHVTLRSYCIGAAHMAWSWLTSEALTVDSEGEIHDLTIRSFGIVRAVDMPQVHVTIDEDDDRAPINGSDAVFAAVAAAGWRASGCRQDWPVGGIMLGN